MEIDEDYICSDCGGETEMCFGYFWDDDLQLCGDCYQKRCDKDIEESGRDGDRVIFVSEA
jgi:hypothetical protein